MQEARQFTCENFQQNIKLILMAGRAKHQGTVFSNIKLTFRILAAN